MRRGSIVPVSEGFGLLKDWGRVLSSPLLKLGLGFRLRCNCRWASAVQGMELIFDLTNLRSLSRKPRSLRTDIEVRPRVRGDYGLYCLDAWLAGSGPSAFGHHAREDVHRVSDARLKYRDRARFEELHGPSGLVALLRASVCRRLWSRFLCFTPSLFGTHSQVIRVSRRLHRRYDQAIVQRSLGLAGKRGYSLRDGLRIIAASHPFRRWRSEAGKILEDSAIDDEGILKRIGEKQLMSPSETGRIAIALKRGDWSEVALRRSNGMLETAIHRWLYAARTWVPYS